MYLIGDEELEALRALFEKKKFYRHQPGGTGECEQFEKEFSAYTGAAHSLLLSSGTNALAISLLAANLQPGDEVLIPVYTFVATAQAVVQAGGIPVLVNIDRNLSLDLTEAAARVSPRTKMMILVHMDGLAANIEGAVAFCKRHDLTLIEDVAQAIGADFGGKKLGTFGEFGCFSLNDNKNISCGEGGILITNGRAGFEKAFCLHDGPAQFNPTKKDFFTEITPFMGLSARVSEIQGTIMRVQLRRLDFILTELRKRKSILAQTLAGVKGFEIVKGFSAGECASSLHLQFDGPERAAVYGKKLREAGYLFAPVTSRPAHAGWKWSHLLGEKSHIQRDSNPYLKTEVQYSYPVAEYLQSVEILTRTCRMDVGLELSLAETQAASEKLKSLLES